ncbi:MAG: glycoside hydrolase family 97 protein, partial [Ekhidna sp.]|nr:glycoside hydrolase family 97 protein [Ekhidna sp.]
ITNQYNELYLTLKHTSKITFDVVFRVFDDGVGFRYIFPDQETLTGDLEIMNEKSEFNLHVADSAWWIKSYAWGRYENLFKKTVLDSIHNFVHTPFTIEKDNGLFVSIHEADLKDYSSMSIQKKGDGNLEADLAKWNRGKDGVEVRVKTKAPFQTPWRTITIGERAGDLIESTIVLNLNEPNVLEDISWIKPVKYVGIWWGMHLGIWTFGEGENHGATTERANAYIDFAAAHGFDEVLIEGWNKGFAEEKWFLSDGSTQNFTTPADDYDAVQVAEYAQSKGVNIQAYHETLANTKNYLSQLDSSFAYARSLGYRSAKIGHVGQKMRSIQGTKEYHYGQYGVEYYRSVLQKAAEYGIMVNFHEPIKATGERRTYPNMMTREGARGMEYNAWSKDGGNPPEHTVILPFTRSLGGPMDYTPGNFNLLLDRNQKPNKIQSTLANQLALFVTLYSPVQMASDLIENYEGHPAFQFIKNVPVDWETSKVVEAKIGDFVVIARKDKHSHDWYLGGITDENARELTLSLDFLEEGKTYQATIYRDAADSDYETNPRAYEIEKKDVQSGEILDIRLARAGGVAIRFEKK